MRVGAGHLTYCSNIHAGETWTSVRETLGEVLPALRRRLDLSGPMAIGLRLSAMAADDLSEPAVLEECLAFLRDGGYYVLTINGFPYGAFHGARVKECVYAPDWRDERRLTYTNRLADLLHRLSDPGLVPCPSISTVPGAFRSHVTTDADRDAIADGYLRAVAHLIDLHRRTGRVITLAIEPEPACQMETTAEVVSFVTGWVLDADRVARIGRDSGVELSPASIRRHLGVCLDTCHLAVAHEDPAQALDTIARAGLSVFKVQVSSALSAATPSTAETRAALAPFADDVYLHQVVEPGDPALRFTDLPEALDAVGAARAGAAAWRIHFHVPIFLEQLGALSTTQRHLRETLHEVQRRGVCDQFEVETYTWDVLPAAYRTVDRVSAIARELEWARAELGGAAD